QRALIGKKARFFVIDAYSVARDTGMGSRMNTILQVCFFAISKILPGDEAIEAIRKSIRYTYGRKGEDVVQKNMKAVDETLAHLHEVKVPAQVTSTLEIPEPFPTTAPAFDRNVLGVIYENRGDELPVSAFPVDGTFPTGTAKWEKRNLALEIPVWDTKICIQCGKCAYVCPHSVIRIKVFDSTELAGAPPTFKSTEARDKEFTGLKYSIQVAPEDCTGCAICVETPYLKLLSQLFGDRALIANATGCSSIYGGNLPTTPWAKNAEGRGPVWSNSLFEDNAEFGLGFRLSIDKQTEFARELVKRCNGQLGDELINGLLNSPQKDESDIYDQRQRVVELKDKLKNINTPDAKQLLQLADMLVKKSVWIVGGDGWAYDIGYGGLDHVIASGRNVNLLVLDTEVYSNTGGQQSKATPRAAVAKFAAGGKPGSKKDLGMMAMAYGSVYVASVAMGAKDEHTLKAFLEAEAYDGPSIIIAYAHCIAHGIDMTTGMQNQKAIVDSG